MIPSRLAALVIRLRWVFIVVFTALTAFFAWQIPKAEFDTEMKNQLPQDLPTRVNLAKIEELFGGTDMAMIVLSTDDILRSATLERLQKLSAKLERMEEFQRVVSLFTAKHLRIEDGEMIVEAAVPEIPNSDAGRAQLRKRLEQNPIVYGNLISKDFRHGVLIGFLDPKASDEVLVGKLEALAAEVAGPEQTYLGGMPVTRVRLTQDMRKDMRRFLPVGLLIMLGFLLTCFRQARGVLLPFVMTVMAIAVVMGLVPLLGWKIHTVTILLPVILLAVANNYGIHILARYQEDNAPGTEISSRELASRGIVKLTWPILATGLTTMVGMLCLSSHIVIPAKQLGVLAASGVVFAMVGSLVFIPAVLAILPRAKPIFDARASRGPSTSRLERVLSLFARSVARRPRAILLSSLLVALGMGWGATRVVVDTNPMSFYRQTDPIWRSTHLLNEHLGGWAGVSIVAEGDIKDPKVLQQIDDLEQHLRKNKLVGTTTSIAGVMRKMNQVMHDGNPAFDRIPKTRELVAQYLLLYSMSGDPQDFEKLVDFPYRHAQLMAKVTDSGTRAATEVLDYTRAYLAERPGSSSYLVGGFLALLCAALVSMLLRSVVAGLFAAFPLLLALTMMFGVMGLSGIELNLVTALLSSIMIGVGIDYSIHFMWRYRDERANGLSPERAVERTLTTTGRGIVFNALSVVIGFIVLLISAFFPVQFFGLLVAISILASLVGALVVLPATAVVFRPRFLEPVAVPEGGGYSTV
jgi:hydrophobe/amphiphile efflux-3 (HAE3) family protein